MSVVPGPPRGRRRHVGGDLAARVEMMRAAEQAPTRPGVLLGLVRDVILLLKDLVTDHRVPIRARMVAGLALAYIASPVDVVPDAIPVLGQLDDLGVALVAVRVLLSRAGYEVIYDLWRGSDLGLALVLTLAGVEE